MEVLSFCNAVIKVSHNYVYEHPKLLGDQKYHNILDATHELSKNYKYIIALSNLESFYHLLYL